MFSFFFGNYDDYREVSTFIVGDYNLEKYAPNSTISWNQIVEPDSWTLGLSKIGFEDVDLEIKATKASIDTGTSYITMPKSDLQSILSYFIDNKSMSCYYDRLNKAYMCSCTFTQYENDFPSLKVTLDGQNVYEMKYEEYIYRTLSRCYFKVVTTSSDSEKWVLGDTFLRGYYSIYDMEN